MRAVHCCTVQYLEDELTLLIVEAGVGDHGLLELVLEVPHLLPQLPHPAYPPYHPVLAAVRAAPPAVEAPSVPPHPLVRTI